MTHPLRIAQVAPPFERVPPRAYGGTERIVFELVQELDRRGHEVTTFASGDSAVAGRHVATVPEALRPIGYTGESLPVLPLDDPPGAGPRRRVRRHPLPPRVVEPPARAGLARAGGLHVPRPARPPVGAWTPSATLRTGSSRSATNQASTHPEVPWTVVHNGLTLTDAPFERRRSDALCFVGRVAPEKGIVEAIEIAQKAGRPLRIAAKIGPNPPERDYNDRRVPAGPPGRRLATSSSSASSTRRTAIACSPRATRP